MANIMAGYWCNLYKGTPAELSIEPAVASLGTTYRTQFPMFLFGIGRFFPDFFLPAVGVVLEVDDDSHDEDEKKAADALRTAALEKLGYVVVRCSNAEALQDPVGTVRRLIVDSGLLQRKGPGIPPASTPTKKNRRKPKSAQKSNSHHTARKKKPC